MNGCQLTGMQVDAELWLQLWGFPPCRIGSTHELSGQNASARARMGRHEELRSDLDPPRNLERLPGQLASSWAGD